MMKQALIGTLLFSTSVMAGYEVHIARGDWWESSKTPIFLEEWKKLCESDPSLRLESSVSVQNPVTKEIITLESEGICFWVNPKDGNEYSFDFRSGKVSFRYNEEVMKKAKEIAEKLNALVQGDDGERY